MNVSQPQLYPVSVSTNWLQRYCLSINKSSEQQARWVSHKNERFYCEPAMQKHRPQKNHYSDNSSLKYLKHVAIKLTPDMTVTRKNKEF